MTWLRAATPALAILALTVLEFRALSLGINGTLFGAVVALIAGIGGFRLRRIWEERNGKPTD